MICPIIKFDIKGDYSGKLAVIEKGKELPFENSQIIYISGKKINRYLHILKSDYIIVCLSGELDIILKSNTDREVVHLSNPGIGIYIKSIINKEIVNVSEDCEIMIIVSQKYKTGISGNNLTINSNEKYKMFDLETDNICIIGDQPFKVVREFHIFDVVSNIKRGCHANRESSFLMYCTNGTCKVSYDTGYKRETVELGRGKLFFLNKMVWKEMFDFSEGAILSVLSDKLYDSKEYIRDYDQFLKEETG